MRLLAENELHPAFPSDAFTVVRAQVARSVAGQLRTAGYLVRRALKQAIVPDGDPKPATIHTGIGDGAATPGRAWPYYAC